MSSVSKLPIYTLYIKHFKFYSLRPKKSGLNSLYAEIFKKNVIYTTVTVYCTLEPEMGERLFRHLF